MGYDFQLNTLTQLFKQNAHKKNSVRMAQYMKGHFSYFGIKSPLRKKLQREWWQGESIKYKSELVTLISGLWELEEREFQYVALDLGKRYKKYLSPNSIPFTQNLVMTKSWWDTVDAIASHFVGAVVYNSPETRKIMDEWIDHKNMWIRRTAILHQLNFKEKTDSDRLFLYCEKRMGETDFFIRKAIGWALRQYSYIDSKSVIQFVKYHDSELSTLSKTESLKALKREGVTT